MKVNYQHWMWEIFKMVMANIFGRRKGLLETKRLFYQLSGVDFVTGFTGLLDRSTGLIYDHGKTRNGTGIAIAAWAGVDLPEGALITDVIVYGNNAAKTWQLVRSPVSSDAEQSMAFGNINSRDTSINFPEIDNTNYTYSLAVNLDNTNSIYGATIIYDTR